MNVAIVIPNWNGAPLLERALQSLREQSCPIAQIVVVDNGSQDNSVAIASAAGAVVIELGRNTGFSNAVNCGIRAAGADWIVILNNDVWLQKDWLAALVETATREKAWFAAGKLLAASQKGTLDGSFDAVCRGGCAWRCGHGRQDSPIWNRSRPIRFAPLTAALFRAEVFNRVGLLDEEFESYLEDVDFGIRCATQGLGGVYVPEAVAFHEGSATLGGWHPDTVRKIARNQLLLIAKHYPRRWVLSYGWQVLVAQGLWGFTALSHGRFIAYLAGKLDGLRRFRASRGKLAPGLDAVLAQSEAEILELQRLTGFDLYWRLYFALT